MNMCETITLEGPKGVEPVHAQTLGANPKYIGLENETKVTRLSHCH